jgi:hypothetical protein
MRYLLTSPRDHPPPESGSEEMSLRRPHDLRARTRGGVQSEAKRVACEPERSSKGRSEHPALGL